MIPHKKESREQASVSNKKDVKMAKEIWNLDFYFNDKFTSKMVINVIRSVNSMKVMSFYKIKFKTPSSVRYLIKTI